MTYTDIAKEIHVNEKTIRRIFHGESGSIDNLVAICLSMQLPPMISQHIIKRSKWNLDLTQERHQILYTALQYHHTHCYPKIVEFLHQHGVSL